MKMTMDDPFWDVRAQEEDARQKIDMDIHDLEGQIGLAEKCLVLKAAPGWVEFVRLVEAQALRRREEMVLCLTDREAAVLQGRCREITSILGLMNRAEESVATLTERLQTRQAEREKRFSGGIVKPIGAIS